MIMCAKARVPQHRLLHSTTLNPQPFSLCWWVQPQVLYVAALVQGTSRSADEMEAAIEGVFWKLTCLAGNEGMENNASNFFRGFYL